MQLDKSCDKSASNKKESIDVNIKRLLENKGKHKSIKEAVWSISGLFSGQTAGCVTSYRFSRAQET